MTWRLASGGLLLALGTMTLWRGAALVVPFGRRFRIEAWSRRVVATVVLVLALVAGLAAIGHLGPFELLLASVVLASVAWMFERARFREAGRVLLSPGARGGLLVPRELYLPLTLTLGVLYVDLLVFWPAPPFDWDAMTYHLYLPARWLQEGRWHHVPTVFGDNAAAFAPQNGGLIFAWLMALTASDAATNTVQIGVLVFLGTTLYRGARCLGASRLAAGLAGLGLCWSTPLRKLASSANVDLLLLASWMAALVWILRYRRTGEAGTLVWGGVVAGLAAGTKVVGLPLAGFLGVVLLPVLWLRRSWRGLWLFAVPAVAVGSGWYLLNLWRYGNPLFPLRIELGPWVFPGAYGAAAVRAGEFHLSEPGALISSVIRGLGVGPWIWAIVGWLGLLLAGSRRWLGTGLRAALWMLAGLWMLFFAVYVPHNNQARFLLPAFLLAGLGWALVFDALRARGRVLLAPAWLAGILLGSGILPMLRRWWVVSATLAEGGVSIWQWVIPAGLCLGGGAWWGIRARRVRSWIPIALVVVLMPLAAIAANTSRALFYSRSDFQAWAPGVVPFSDPGAPALRIAYTGANFPYALTGGRFRHRVVYVNTQGDPGDGFYEFWRLEPRVYEYHKPGLYRGADNKERWLENLRSEGIELLVIFRLHRAEARYLSTTDDGFPIEQVWARQHPEIFEPVVQHPVVEMYRIRSPVQLIE